MGSEKNILGEGLGMKSRTFSPLRIEPLGEATCVRLHNKAIKSLLKEDEQTLANYTLRNNMAILMAKDRGGEP
jgi:hypothetical protein